MAEAHSIEFEHRVTALEVSVQNINASLERIEKLIYERCPDSNELNRAVIEAAKERGANSARIKNLERIVYATGGTALGSVGLHIYNLVGG